MNRDEILEFAKDVWGRDKLSVGRDNHFDFYVDLVRAAIAAEREAIADEFSQRLQSDLEHGVKSLNKAAWQRFATNYPELNEFSDWLAVRGEE